MTGAHSPAYGRTIRTPVIVPENAKPCQLCGILLGIPGISEPAENVPDLCHDCGDTHYRGEIMSEAKTNSMGWGAVEKAAPTLMRNSKRSAGIALIIENAGPDWQRIAAPSHPTAGMVAKAIRDKHPHIKVTCRRIDDTTFVYFRLKGQGE